VPNLESVGTKELWNYMLIKLNQFQKLGTELFFTPRKTTIAIL